MDDLVAYAHAQGRAFTAQLDRHAQKALGQFMTPPAIARFMARRALASVSADPLRILEPAAGAGILAAAAVEELIARSPEARPARAELLLHEFDERLLLVLHRLADRLRQACASAGVQLDVVIEGGDFLLSKLARSGQPVPGLVTIANPPYFKLNKSTDPRCEIHSYAVYGQPNIYGLFMAACARLTPPDGRFCFITPRSWMSGAYFSAVRREMLRCMRLDALHAFDSRRAHFEEDAILQEAVITWATGRAEALPGPEVLITRSHGVHDLDDAPVQAMPLGLLLAADEHLMIRLPEEAARSLDDPLTRWTSTLASYGLRVSTGPVVAFRSTEFIREHRGPGTVPLLWMQHVTPEGCSWPIKKKREHIVSNARSAWMLVPNSPMVVMRRFSPKEAVRRVTAAAYTGHLDAPALGLENHLNYIHQPGGEMSAELAKGLAAFLNSRLVDRHFRALAGSTQVNATELRKLPLPPLAVLQAIGQGLRDRASLAEQDSAVEGVLGSKEQPLLTGIA